MNFALTVTMLTRMSKKKSKEIGKSKNEKQKKNKKIDLTLFSSLE